MSKNAERIVGAESIDIGDRVVDLSGFQWIALIIEGLGLRLQSTGEYYYRTRKLPCRIRWSEDCDTWFEVADELTDLSALAEKGTITAPRLPTITTTSDWYMRRANKLSEVLYKYAGYYDGPAYDPQLILRQMQEWTAELQHVLAQAKKAAAAERQKPLPASKQCRVAPSLAPTDAWHKAGEGNTEE